MPDGNDQSGDQPSDQPSDRSDEQTRTRPAYRPPSEEHVSFGKQGAEHAPPHQDQAQQDQVLRWATDPAQSPRSDWVREPQQPYGHPPGQPPAQPFYGASQGYQPGPPPPGYGATATSGAPVAGTSGTGALGRALAVLGLGTIGAGLFALPLATYPRRQGSTYFGTVRDFVRLVPDRTAGRFYNGLAQFWWDWGLLLGAGVLVVLVAIAVATPAARVIGVVIALVALAAGALQAFALAGSADLREASITFRKDHSMYEHAGIGIWVGFVGFGVLVLAGLLLTAARRRD